MALASLIATGTKVWLDGVEPNEIKKNRSWGVTGATSNPTIVSKIISRGHFDDRIAALIHQGLTDEQIPLGAKIVSLADSFDAMTTDRPYRRRRSFPDVVRDLRQNSGKQFDGKVVAAFARAMLKEVSGDAKERRIMKMLGKGYINPEEAPDLLKDLLEDLDADNKLKAESV